jgi:hypothetical protein
VTSRSIIGVPSFGVELTGSPEAAVDGIDVDIALSPRLKAGEGDGTDRVVRSERAGEAAREQKRAGVIFERDAAAEAVTLGLGVGRVGIEIGVLVAERPADPPNVVQCDLTSALGGAVGGCRRPTYVASRQVDCAFVIAGD